ncbi:MAG: hypothetical protein ABEJ68_04095 [Halobacteriaceae archaeon]
MARDTGTHDPGLRARLAGLFALRPFLIVLVATVGLAVAGISVPVLGDVGAAVGAGAGGFTVGAAGRRRYAEVAAAGALGGGVTALFDRAVTTLVWAGPPILTAGAAVGAGAGALGHYLGRDLRAGLTRPLH